MNKLVSGIIKCGVIVVCGFVAGTVIAEKNSHKAVVKSAQ